MDRSTDPSTMIDVRPDQGQEQDGTSIMGGGMGERSGRIGVGRMDRDMGEDGRVKDCCT